ncbi:MAG: hypothetical protein J2P36_18965 [Ktedonobacteraceae bacterium]|nr:hypothetical protein [Ktedonobacteraceae bacterium]
MKEKLLDFFKKRGTIIPLVVVIAAILVSVLAYRLVASSHPVVATTPVASPTELPTATPANTATPTPSYTTLPTQNPSKILGIDGDSKTPYPGVSWIRMGYPTCGWGNERGQTLKNTIEKYHKKGVRVLLTFCQGPSNNDARLYDAKAFADAAQGRPDAVQCGNEQMKRDASVSFLYIPPQKFAKFYDMCERAMHAVRKDIPVLLGSLDPHVASADYAALAGQVNYLDQMQDTMNSSVHPGGNWDWHTKALGLIDSWHNGYPDASVNNVLGLFQFWARQFQVDLNSGQLGKHLWVVEGTGCFKGCGVPDSAYAIAVSHMLTLILDVQTAMNYKVPFFFFSGKDFYDQGVYWPIGVLNDHGKPKPIRQDLAMGARTLNLSCPHGNVTVRDQMKLLAQLYAGCKAPDNYASIIYS